MSLAGRVTTESCAHWRSWGPDAFATAHTNDTPLLLVLERAGRPAHDVPPDPAATPLGPAFVCVRADADDHPGLATLAHAAVKVATGRTSATAVLFLTPEGFPFAASGPLPLVQLLAWAAHLDAGWQQRRPVLLANAQRLAAALAAPLATTSQPSAELVGEAIGVLSGRLDPRGEPAFLAVDALLRWHRRNGSPRALHGAETALGALLSGPLADQANGGFFAQLDPANPGQAWPFKPLALNALAARTLVLAWRITGRAVYRHAAETTLAWLTGAPAHPDGGSDPANQPDRDDRRLLAANALLLGTLAACAPALARPDLAVAAHDLGQHLLDWPRSGDGRCCTATVIPAKPARPPRPARPTWPRCSTAC